MKNYGKLLKAGAVLITLLLIQLATFAQCNGGFPNGTCDPGEDPACFDCQTTPMPTPGNAPIKESAGDDPCTATPLKTGLACVQYSNDTSTATTTPGTPSCWADAQLDVWFSFVATSQDMTVSTDAVIFELFPGTSNNDTEIALYSSAGGACASLTEMGCDTDAGINSGINLSTGTSSPTRQGLIERTGLVPGDTYYIRVHGKSGGKGNFCVNAFDTYTVGSKPCEAQVVHPNNMACDKNNGNMVINTTSQGPGGAVVNTIQPGAYVPIGSTWAGCSPAGTATQYGTWTTFTPEANGGGSVTVANSSGNAVDYTLFYGVCTNPICVESKPAANGASVSFAGIVAGRKYYILTTLQGGATTTVVKTDLCVTNASPPKHPETEKNEGNVPGAGGTAQSDHCPAFEIVVDQVYKTTTYAADKDGAASCAYGRNVWFTWKVPATYPKTNGVSAAFFQMWNKNCNTGPGTIGTRLIVGAAILGDPCSGSCLEFSSPSQTGASGSSGDLDPYTDAATNVGWDPSAYGNQYWGIFQSGNDGSGNAQENCDFNFMIGSTPSLKGIAINDATICQGSSATLTASGGTAYEWWDGSTAVSRTFSPTVTTNYTVTATAGADGYSTGKITVIPYPFTLSVTPGAICSGSSSATLTATSNTTSGFATSYTWTPSTNLNVTSGATVLANPPSTRTYTVTGTIAASPSFAGCKASATSVVTVGGSIPVTVNNGTVCPGAGAVLTASGANTYTWTPATNISPGTATGATVTVTPTGSTTYTVRGENNGCFGTATSNVTISSSPTITASNATICSGSTASLTAGGGVSYVWKAGDYTTNPFVTPALTTATNYTVIGTDASGCKGTAVSSVTMAPGLTITVNNSTICSGLTTTLTAAGAGAGGTYTWQPGNIPGNPFTTPALSAPTSYTVTGVDASGCSGSAVANVTIASGLTITVSGNDGVCPGASNTLVAAGADTYTWSPPDFLNTTSGATVTSTPSATTTYTVVGDANGCTGTATSTVQFTDYDDASFSYQSAGFCAPATAIATKNSPPVPAGTGTFSMTPNDPNMTLNTTTGDIAVAAGAAVQPYVVTLMTAGACPNSYSLTINVVANPDATFSYPLPNYCKNGPTNPTITQPTGSTPGNFSATPAGMVFVGTSGTEAGQIDLTASAPGNYTVTNDIPAGGGCPPTSATTTVVIDPVPTVTVSSTTVCAGTAGTITAGGADTYTWQNPFPAGASLTDSPSATTPYTVTGTANGCSSTATGTIYVDQNPVVGVIPPPAAVCPGQSATMTATGANSYTWVGASGPYPSTPGLTDSPVATATYTVTGTIGICTGTSTGVITVGSAPAITTADATICSGSTGATLTANGGITYAWSHGQGNTSSINVNPINTTTYTVTGTGPTAGCDGIAYATVVVNTTPIPSVTAVPATICAGQSSTVTASPSGAASYVWSSSGSGNPLTVSPASTTPYTVTVTTTENCSATASGTVTVIPIPTVSVNNATICAGETASLTASGASSYAWSPNIGTTATVTASPLLDASYTVTGNPTTCPVTAVSSVVVNQLPVVTINSATICIGESAILIASGASAYSWAPAADLDISTGATVTADPTATTNYTVVATGANGCVRTVNPNVIVNNLPAINPSSNITIIYSNSTILTSSGGGTYAWTPSEGLSCTNCATPTATPTVTTNYCVTVVDGNGCVDSTCINVTVEIPCPTNENLQVPNAFSPNGDGRNDLLILHGWGDCIVKFTFAVFDRWGEKVFESEDPTAAWDGNFRGKPLDPAVFVYFITADFKEGDHVVKQGNISLIR